MEMPIVTTKEKALAALEEGEFIIAAAIVAEANGHSSQRDPREPSVVFSTGMLLAESEQKERLRKWIEQYS